MSSIQGPKRLEVAGNELELEVEANTRDTLWQQGRELKERMRGVQVH